MAVVSSFILLFFLLLLPVIGFGIAGTIMFITFFTSGRRRKGLLITSIVFLGISSFLTLPLMAVLAGM